MLTVGTLLVALILALGGTAVTALIVSAVLATAAVLSVVLAYNSAPKKVLGHTREHFKETAGSLKEHVV